MINFDVLRQLLGDNAVEDAPEAYEFNASFFFGGLYILHIFLPTGMNLAVKELYKMIPYVITILVLIITSVRSKRENQPPASLGLPYFREER